MSFDVIILGSGFGGELERWAWGSGTTEWGFKSKCGASPD